MRNNNRPSLVSFLSVLSCETPAGILAKSVSGGPTSLYVTLTQLV